MKEWTLIFPLHCDLAELSLSFTLYFPFRSDLLKEFYHSEVIWWTLNSRLISLTLFVKQVIILVQSFLDNDFLLDFSLVVSLQFVPLRCSVLSISRNSVHNSDAFTFMLIAHWNFHWRNISSFEEHLLRKLSLMAEPKCNGTSRTRYILLVTDFSLPNLRFLNRQSIDGKINAKHGRY